MIKNTSKNAKTTFLILMLFLLSTTFIHSKDFFVKSLLNDEFSEWFGENGADTPDDSRVRYLIATPWAPLNEDGIPDVREINPDDIEYVLFFSAGQQTIGSSTKSNITGFRKGGQEDFFNTDNNTVKKMLKMFINMERFKWFKEEVPRASRALIGGVIGTVLGGSVGGIIGGIIGGVAGAVKVVKDMDYRIDNNKTDDMTFFEYENLAKKIYNMESIQMPDGTTFNRNNTLLIINIRGLCISEYKDDPLDSFSTLLGYTGLMSDCTNNFKNVRLAYLAGHSRGGVQVLELGRRIRDLYSKKTRVVVSAIDAVAKDGELGTTVIRDPFDLDEVIINPYESFLAEDSKPLILADILGYHNNFYFSFYSDLQEYLDINLTKDQADKKNYDGDFYVNNLVSGSLINEDLLTEKFDNWFGKVANFLFGEGIDYIVGLIIGSGDNTAVSMDYDKSKAREIERHNLLGCYSQNWVHDTHINLCTNYRKASLDEQLEYFFAIGFFPVYNITTEVAVNSGDPAKPVISWDQVDGEIWNNRFTGTSRISGYKVYRKIVNSGDPVPADNSSVMDWTYIGETPDTTIEDDLSTLVSAGDKIYYKVTCVITSDGKYEYQSKSTYSTGAYEYSDTPAHDIYLYNNTDPLSKKYASVPRYKYDMELVQELSENEYSELPWSLKKYYTPVSGMYELTEPVDNGVEFDIFGNAISYYSPGETDQTYKSSFSGSFYAHDEITNQFSNRTLDYIMVSTPVKILPIDILNYTEGMDFEYHMNGGSSEIPVLINENLAAYGLSKLAEGITEMEFVYNSKGEGLFLSPDFKEGYNSIYIRFNDAYDNANEITIMQNTVPPFIKPIFPVRNEYVDSSRMTGNNLNVEVLAVQITEDIFPEGYDWFDDENISIKITIDDYELNEDDYLKHSDRRITFFTGDLNNHTFELSEGNHILEITITASGKKSYAGWQFWVDKIPPVVSYPQRMIFSSNNGEIGHLQAYVEDFLPFRNKSGEILTRVDTVYLNKLVMSITDELGNPLVDDFISINTKYRLGVFGGPWDGTDNYGAPLDHGTYYLKVEAGDRSNNEYSSPAFPVEGNAFEKARVIIDNEGPELSAFVVNCDTRGERYIINAARAGAEPLPAVSYTMELDPWEEFGFLRLEFTDIDTLEHYTYNIGEVAPGTGSYELTPFLNSRFAAPDGIYELTLVGEDEIGNEEVITVAEIEVDRTAPVLEYANIFPFTVTSGNSFNLAFNGNSKNDASPFTNDTLDIRLYITDREGSVLSELSPIKTKIFGSEVFSEDFPVPGDLSAGKYFITITAADSRENEKSVTTAFIIDALPPEITAITPCVENSNPLEVYRNGTITIKGNAIDPRFNNEAVFERYTLYYKLLDENNEPDIPVNLDNPESAGWLYNGINVPSYQVHSGWLSNSGRYPVDNAGILGTIDGQVLPPEKYLKILLIAEETDGSRTGAVKTVHLYDNITDPYAVDLEITSDFQQPVNFLTDSDRLEVNYSLDSGFENPVTIQAYIRQNDTDKIIKSFIFRDIIIRDISGEPDLTATDKNIMFYRMGDRYHLVMKNNTGADDIFITRILTGEQIRDINYTGYREENVVNVARYENINLFIVDIPEDETFSVDFIIPGENDFSIRSAIDEQPETIYFGGNMIPAESGEEIKIAGKGNEVYLPVIWNGKGTLEDGVGTIERWCQNGEYTCYIEAVGNNGGYDSEQISFSITTPPAAKFLSIHNNTIRPYIGEEDLCIVQVASEKAGTFEVDVLDRSSNLVVKTLGPYILEKPGILTFTWDGTGDDGQVLTSPGTEYLFLVRVISEGGNQAILIIGEGETITVDTETQTDNTITAEIIFPEDGAVVMGDSTYTVEVNPEGIYLPEVQVNLELEASGGTQMVEAAPYLNYMASAQKIYTKIGAEIEYIIETDEFDNNPDHTVDFIVAEYDPGGNEFILVDNNEEFTIKSEYWSNKPQSHGDLNIEDIQFTTRSYTKGKDYMTGDITIDYIENSSRILSAFPDNPQDDGKYYYNYEYKIRITYGVVEDYNFFTTAATSYTMGPDIMEETDYTVRTDYVTASGSLFEEFTFEDSSDEENFWLIDDPVVRFSYIGESYPDASPDGEPEFDDILLERYEFDDQEKIPGAESIMMSQGAHEYNGAIEFYCSLVYNSDNKDGYIMINIFTDAVDNITLPLPYDRNKFFDSNNNRHPHDYENPPGTILAHLNRERTGAPYDVPYYELKEADVYFQEDLPTAAGTTQLSSEFKPPAPPTYKGTFNLSGLFSSENNPYNPDPERLNIEAWTVTAVNIDNEAPIKNITNLLDREVTINNQQINIPGASPSCGVFLEENNLEWDLRYDTVINPSGPSSYDPENPPVIRSGARSITDNYELLHTTGKLPGIRFFDLYLEHSSRGEIELNLDPANLFLKEPDRFFSNEHVLIHDQFIPGTMYDVQLKGIDGNPYGGLEVLPGDIIYSDKAEKMIDNVILSLSNDVTRRFIPVKANWDNSAGATVSLSYRQLDGHWVNILAPEEPAADPSNNILAYWDVTGLNGFYYLKLTIVKGTGINTDFLEVYVGEKITEDHHIIQSAKGEAALFLPEECYDTNTAFSIDSVNLEDIRDFVEYPDLPMVGKVINLQPDGFQFNEPANLSFTYYRSELQHSDLSRLQIYELNPDGTLERLNTIRQFFDANDEIILYDVANPDDWEYVKIWSEVTHFSYYCLLQENLIRGPVLDPDYIITGQSSVDVSGRAAPGRELTVYIQNHPLMTSETAEKLPVPATYAGKEGAFSISGIALPYEGYNYIYVGYADNNDISESMGRLIVLRDTGMSQITVLPYYPVISPNNDGLHDVLPLSVFVSEEADVQIAILDSNMNPVFISAPKTAYADKRTIIMIDGKDSPGHIIPDGEYSITVIATDRMGNTAESTNHPLIIDITGSIVFEDRMPPVTNLTAGQPQYTDTGGRLFITSGTELTLTASDETGGTGVAQLHYRINRGSWTIINGEEVTFVINDADGDYTLEFKSYDAVGNQEEIKSQTLYLDNSAPEINLLVKLTGTTRQMYLDPNETEIELTNNEKIIAEVYDPDRAVPSGLAGAKFRIDNGSWYNLTPENFDALLLGKEEAAVEIEGIDNLGNTNRRFYIISHYALFSVPGAVISTVDGIILNSNILIDSYNSKTGETGTRNGDVISKMDVRINSTLDIRGEVLDYTDTRINGAPVPGSAQVMERLILNSTDVRVLNPGEYYIKDLIINSGGRLVIAGGGYVKIWFNNGTIDGTIEVDKVKHLWMIGTNQTSYMNINGNTDFKGVLYVPNVAATVNGYLDGSIIARSVIVNSNATVMYDEDLQIHNRW